MEILLNECNSLKKLYLIIHSRCLRSPHPIVHTVFNLHVNYQVEIICLVHSTNFTLPLTKMGMFQTVKKIQDFVRKISQIQLYLKKRSVHINTIMVYWAIQSFSPFMIHGKQICWLTALALILSGGWVTARNIYSLRNPHPQAFSLAYN